MSDNNRDFGFCPRCGALMQNGVCQSCSYMERGVQSAPPNPNVQLVRPERQKKKTSGAVIAACIIAGVLLFLALIASVIFFFRKSMQIAESSANDYSDSYYDDDYYNDYYDDYYDNYGYGYYEPDESDPYYEEITDSTRTDLDYKVLWAVDSVTPDDSSDYCSYYSTYPILKGEDEEQFAAANAKILEMASEYKDSYTDYAGGCSTYGYVTYMDEEIISVVFKHNIYTETTTMPRLTAVSFRIDTGDELAYSEMADLDSELAMRFRAQDKTQNGGVDYVQGLTDEELLEVLSDRNSAAMFYTPVGLEIGFNYDGGWVTVTLKDLAL